MTARPHDAMFQSALEAPSNAAVLLRELLPAAVRAAVVWKTLGCERESFVDSLLADHHCDLLFSAKLRTGAPKLVYFLLEHQSAGTPRSILPIRSAIPRSTQGCSSRC